MILEQSDILNDISQFGQRIAQKHFISSTQTQTFQITTNIRCKAMIKIDSGGHFGIRRDGHRSFVVLSQSVVDMRVVVNRLTPLKFSKISIRNLPSKPSRVLQHSIKSIEFIGLQCNGWRLPTSMEWEYLATAGRIFLFRFWKCF